MILELSVTLMGALGVGLWLRRRRDSRGALANSAVSPGEPESAAPQRSLPALTHDAHDAHDGLALGDTVGGFVLEEFLGEGGMASVFQARKRAEPGSKVALKVLKEAISTDEQFRRRFHREVELCQELSHPNVVGLQEWGEDKGRLFLALEYVDGQSLTQHLSPEGLALADVRRYLDGLIQGLNYAHQLGIVHRDLKPDNVMVTRAGQIKIMDFGLARSEDGEKVTKTGDSMGTPAYLPPEQITGAKPTPAADQYSLGVMLYEMLTGRRPFLEKNLLKQLMQHMTEVPPNPLEIRPDLDPTCASIVLRMLEKSPENRFAKLETVLEGLTAVENGLPWQLPEAPRLAAAKVDAAEVTIAMSGQHDDDTVGFQVTT